VPSRPELAMGAIGEGGIRVVNDEVVRLGDITERQFAAVERRERAELDRRAALYRTDPEGGPEGDRVDPLSLEGRTVVIVDDGIATGSTARAACEVARARGARSITLAVPVAPVDWIERLGTVADECITLATPEPFGGVGRFYRDFRQVGDDEVLEFLHRSAVDGSGTASTPAREPVVHEDLVLDITDVRLTGHLSVPAGAGGLVVFAHGSGSSRLSPRNQYVAAQLNAAGLATLLFDLLTPAEESDRGAVFDIDLLADRLASVATAARSHPSVVGLPVGLFGASTGAAAALVAAAQPGSEISAVVSRGGRPDLAAGHLDRVTCPTLLIVGGRDDAILDLNEGARQALPGDAELQIVPGATHLFAEPGALDTVARLATGWFRRHAYEPGGTTKPESALPGGE
ncbi:MAG: phosphoribosyltransferase, partial [Acidimicrobiales bacterium]|nr:phosphoribosyltransferase [Acidimicrobiales bacterium]